MNKKDQLTYKQAIEELERIVSEIENEDIDVDLLAEKVKRATFLNKYCKTKLRKTEEELKKLLEEIEKESEESIDTPPDSNFNP